MYYLFFKSNIFGGFIVENCTSCGAKLQPGVKFCTKCGSRVQMATQPMNMNTSPASTAAMPKMANEKMDQLKKQSMNYFGWYLETIKHPSKVVNESKYFGLVSFLLHTIVFSYAFYAFLNSMFTPFAKYLAAEKSTFGFMSAAVPTGMDLYFKIFPLVLAGFVMFIAVGFVCKKFMVDPQTDMFSYTNQLATYSNSLLIAELLIALFIAVSMPGSLTAQGPNELIRNVEMLSLLFFIVPGFFAIAYTASIIVDRAQVKIDKIYVVLIAVMSNTVVFFIIMNIVRGQAQGKYMETIGKNFGKTIASMLGIDAG